MKNYTFKINENEYNVQIEKLDKDSNHARVIVNGVEYDVEVAGRTKPVAAKSQLGTVKAAPVAEAAPIVNKPRPAVGGGAITSPLPGTVVSVNVAVGDKVTMGQTIMVLEAMKMENNITADRDGVVKEIAAQKGAAVMEGDTLIVVG
jgi:biotin carboxyl carrier protein